LAELIQTCGVAELSGFGKDLLLQQTLSLSLLTEISVENSIAATSSSITVVHTSKVTHWRDLTTTMRWKMFHIYCNDNYILLQM